MRACDAITVAMVARMTSGRRRASGANRKNGLLMASGSRSSRPPMPRYVSNREGITSVNQPVVIGRRPKWPMSA